MFAISRKGWPSFRTKHRVMIAEGSWTAREYRRSRRAWPHRRKGQAPSSRKFPARAVILTAVQGLRHSRFGTLEQFERAFHASGDCLRGSGAPTATSRRSPGDCGAAARAQCFSPCVRIPRLPRTREACPSPPRMRMRSVTLGRYRAETNACTPWSIAAAFHCGWDVSNSVVCVA